MRVCPARNGKGACACSLIRLLTSGLGRRPEWPYGRREVEAEPPLNRGLLNDVANDCSGIAITGG
jgi:hypothetical protein